MKRGEKYAINAFIIIVVLLITFMFDNSLAHGINNLRGKFLDQIFLGINFLSSEVIIFFILTSLFLWSERKRKWILPLWTIMFFSVVVSFLLKIIIRRQRPFELGIIAKPFTETFSWWNSSFPSFQSMLVFAALPIISKEFPRTKYIWYIFAIATAISRVYFGVHFVSDVFAGAVIGYGVGLLTLKYFQKKIY